MNATGSRAQHAGTGRRAGHATEQDTRAMRTGAGSTQALRRSIAIGPVTNPSTSGRWWLATASMP
ncbi:MAG TPA: hypothetical protein VFK02_27885 [Kofleriaceae bacterium]|nr:hypothetical protein [Kofleriaceae bacterium]